MEAWTVGRRRAAEAPARRPLRELMPAGRSLALVAALGAAFAAASVAEFGWSGRAAVGVVLCPAVILLAAVDLRHRLLPNAIVVPASLLVVAVVAASHPAALPEHLEAGAALFGFFFLFASLFPAGLGMGDAKTGLLLGLALGSRTLPAMMAAFLAVFVAAVWILVRNGLSARTQSLPFGPFLAFGAILAFFLG